MQNLNQTGSSTVNRLNDRAQKLPQDQKLVFMLISQSPLKKIDLRKKTNMSSLQLDKILKELSSINLIKAIKTPASKNQNLWVRSDFQQIEEKKIDNSLIEVLRQMSGNIDDVKNELKRKGYCHGNNNTNNMNDVEILIKMLAQKGQIYYQNNRIWKRDLGNNGRNGETLIGIPCIGCPVFDICSPNGPVSPISCIYFEQW